MLCVYSRLTELMPMSAVTYCSDSYTNTALMTDSVQQATRNASLVRAESSEPFHSWYVVSAMSTRTTMHNGTCVKRGRGMSERKHNRADCAVC